MSYHRSIDGDNDFSRLFFILFNSDPVSACVLLYGIILIQILISLLHAPDYMILTPKIEKSPYHTLPARSLRSLGLGRSATSHLFSKYFLCFSWSQKSPPYFWRPVYATVASSSSACPRGWWATPNRESTLRLCHTYPRSRWRSHCDLKSTEAWGKAQYGLWERFSNESRAEDGTHKLP